jgi:hypothetical protein
MMFCLEAHNTSTPLLPLSNARGVFVPILTGASSGSHTGLTSAVWALMWALGDSVIPNTSAQSQFSRIAPRTKDLPPAQTSSNSIGIIFIDRSWVLGFCSGRGEEKKRKLFDFRA